MPTKYLQDEKAFDFEVGKRITAARKAAHLSQRELAKAIGKNRGRVAAWECGARVSPAALAKLSVVLRVSLQSLVPNVRITNIPTHEPQKLIAFD